MKQAVITITENDEAISFDMKENSFSKAEIIGFLSQLVFQLNHQLLKRAIEESEKQKPRLQEHNQ